MFFSAFVDILYRMHHNFANAIWSWNYRKLNKEANCYFKRKQIWSHVVIYKAKLLSLLLEIRSLFIRDFWKFGRVEILEVAFNFPLNTAVRYFKVHKRNDSVWLFSTETLTQKGKHTRLLSPEIKIMWLQYESLLWAMWHDCSTIHFHVLCTIERLF